MTSKTTLDDVVRVTARVTGVSADKIWSRSRRQDWALARHIAWHVAHEIIGIPQNVIGRQMRRNHTTVGWASHKVGQQAAGDADLAAAVEQIHMALVDHDYVPLRYPVAPSRQRSYQRKRARSVEAPKPPPVKIVGKLCSPEWWASNDASFRAGMRLAALDAQRDKTAAKQSDKLAAFLNVGKTVKNLPAMASDAKSALALPRNLCAGLRSPTPDPMLIQGL